MNDKVPNPDAIREETNGKAYFPRKHAVACRSGLTETCDYSSERMCLIGSGWREAGTKTEIIHHHLRVWRMTSSCLHHETR